MVPTDKNKYFLTRAKERYGEDVEKIYDYSKVNYERARSKLTIRCIKHNVTFTQQAASHIKGYLGCKTCRHETPMRKSVKTTEDVIKRGLEVHKGLDTYEKTNYINSTINITVTCKIHGDYDIRAPKYLSGSRCGKCGVENKYLTIPKAKEIIAKVHGDTYEYDWSTYKNSSSKMSIKCKIHGWFTQRVNTHLSGRGCLKCGVISRTFTQEEAMSKIVKHFRDRYTYDKFVYVNDATEAIVTCKKHGDFRKIPNELFRGNGCPACRESKPERDMINILDDNNIEYIQEYRLVGGRYHYDMYLPKLNVLIEIDGEQHYKSIKHYGGYTNLMNVKRRDKFKNELAAKHTIPLIRIPYFKFDTMEHTFFHKLSKIYKYRHGDKFYKLFIDLIADLKLPASTTKADVVQYLTNNKKTQSSK